MSLPCEVEEHEELEAHVEVLVGLLAAIVHAAGEPVEIPHAQLEAIDGGLFHLEELPDKIRLSLKPDVTDPRS